jgi:hypothetical protein
MVCKHKQASGVWVKGGNGQICNNVCHEVGGTCNSQQPTTLTSNQKVSDAFEKAGYTCKSFHGPRNYPGTPFSKGTDGDDCAPWSGSGTFSCASNQVNSHAPLCYCNTQQAPTPSPTAGSCNPSATETAWRMWGTHSCSQMQSGWSVCTNSGDANHATVMQNCPRTCATARGEPCPPAVPPTPLPPTPVPPTALWPQIGAINSKCVQERNDRSRVASQTACQEKAKEEGHSYYQYAHEAGKWCRTVAACNTPITGTSWDWKIYHQA